METKPGVQTTEFWTNLFVHALTLIQIVPTLFGSSQAFDVNSKWFIIASAISQAFYNAGRGIAKQGIQPNA